MSGATYEVAVSGGTWSLDLGTATPTSGTLTALTDGSSYNVIATVTDAAGNATSETTSNELVIDTTGPSAPTVTTLTTTDTTPTVQGTFDKDDGTVTQVVVNGETYLASGSDLTVDAVNGTWSLTIPAGNELTDATYEVAVTAEDALGNATTDTTSNELVIDTTGPSAPTVTTLTTTDTTPTVQGTFDKDDGTVTQVVVNGETYLASGSDLTVDAVNGTWSLTIPAGNELTDATYEVAVTAEDALGNATTDTTSNELVIDTTGPSAPTVTTLTTTDTTPTVQGTFDKDDGTVTQVVVNGETYLASGSDLTVDAVNGTWSLTIPAGNELTDATYEVAVTAEDALGNATTDTTSNELVIDTTGPSAPTVTTLTTTDTTPTVQGTFDKDDGTVTQVVVNGETYLASGSDLTVDAVNGTWSLTIPAGNELTDATYEVAVTAEDALGNATTDTTSNELVIDTTGPSAPTVTTLTTTDTTPTVQGTFDKDDGTVTQVVVNGETYLASGSDLTVDAVNGTWSLTIPAGNELTDATYEVAVTAEDALGNATTDTTSNELVIDTTGPSAPTVTTLTTTDTTPTVQGTFDKDDGTVTQVVVNGETYLASGSDLTVDAVNGTWSLTIPAGNELTDATYEVAVTAEDALGNATTDTTSNELVIDTTGPSAPTVTTLTTTDTTPTVQGTFDKDDGTVTQVVVNGETYLASGSDLTVDAVNGTWSLTIPAGNELTDATYEVAVTAEDALGNATTDTTSNELVIDTTGPSAPTVTTLTTTDTTPTVQGTFDKDDGTVTQVVVNGETYLASGSDLTVDAVNGTWSLTIPAGNELTDATYEVAVTAEDALGNATTDTTSNELVIDTTGPSAPTVTTLTTTDTTPTVQGTFDKDDGTVTQVVVNGETYLASGSDLTVDAVNGTWSLTIPAGNELTDATYEVAVTAEDALGNATTDTTSNELVIDTTGPSAPTVTTLTTTDTTPTVQGTFDKDDGTVTQVVVNGETYLASGSDLTVDAVNGTWSLTIPAGNELTDATYEVAVTAEDALGNATTDTTSNELVIDTTGPSAPTVTTLTTTDTTPTVQGTFDKDDGTVTQVVVNGETYLASGSDLTVDAVNGTWSLTIPAGNELTDATYEVAVTAEDALGNATTDTTSNELVIDTTGPSAPTVTTLTTTDTTPTVQGTFDKDDGTVTQVVVNGETYLASGSDLTVDAVNGTWSLTIPAGNELTDATYEVAVTAEDALGNATTDTTSNELVIDTTGPSAPTVTTLTTTDTTPTVQGTFDKDDGTVTQVVVNGETYLASGSDLTVDAVNGTWSLTIPAGNELTDATYEVAVTAEDALGNATTDTTSNELVIDTTGPSAPTVTTLTTTDTTPTVQGTFDKDDGTVTQVVVNGETYLASGSDLTVDAVNGTWSLTIPAGNELTDATYEVAVTAEDALGNATTDTTSNELVIDTTRTEPSRR